MTSIGPRCHELRIHDAGKSWRIIYRLDPDAVVLIDVFSKSTRQTPVRILDECRRRVRQYDRLAEE